MAAYEIFFENKAKITLLVEWLFPAKFDMFKLSIASEKRNVNVPVPILLRLVWKSKRLLSSWDFLKVTESAIGWSYGIQKKIEFLKNTCYGVHFWKCCGKEVYNFKNVWVLHRCFTKIKPRFYEHLFSGAALSNCPRKSSRWVNTKRWNKCSLFRGWLRRRSTCCQCAT